MMNLPGAVYVGDAIPLGVPRDPMTDMGKRARKRYNLAHDRLQVRANAYMLYNGPRDGQRVYVSSVEGTDHTWGTAVFELGDDDYPRWDKELLAMEHGELPPNAELIVARFGKKLGPDMLVMSFYTVALATMGYRELGVPALMNKIQEEREKRHQA